MMPARVAYDSSMGRTFLATAVLALCMGLASARSAQQPPPAAGSDPLHRPLDQILDVNVRDGLVYYRSLQSSRGALDRYVASLNVPAATYSSWSREAQMAFWVNAYNAFVLQTVVNRYPIRGTTSAYPASSIRQIPGAFDQTKHRAAGRSVTLDEIEKTVLAEFGEPRLSLALGRGAVGSGRLRSEAYTAARLPEQLEAIQAEFVTRQRLLKVDRTAGQVSTTPILSWNEAQFVSAYGAKAGERFASRSPIERALIAFITPQLLPLEKEFVDENQFKVTFQNFDWRLNDLTGGRIE
jgi:Protein of unknown function, DUF547